MCDTHTHNRNKITCNNQQKCCCSCCEFIGHFGIKLVVVQEFSYHISLLTNQQKCTDYYIDAVRSMTSIVLVPFACHFGQQLFCTFASPCMSQQTIRISHSCWFVSLRRTKHQQGTSDSIEQRRKFLDQPSYHQLFKKISSSCCCMTLNVGVTVTDQLGKMQRHT